VHNAYRIELRGVSMRQRRARLSTEENRSIDKDLPENIPDTHVIHSRAATTIKASKDKT
jgi:hypothetical protein